VVTRLLQAKRRTAKAR